MAVPSECPLCRAVADQQRVITAHVYGGRPGQAFYRCGVCDVSYLYPGLSAEEEKQFYAAEFSSFMTGRAGASAGWEQPERHVKANDAMVQRRMKYLKPRLPGKGRVLEVGCSSGFMLYPLAADGYECVGVEPAGVFGEYVRSRGLRCFDSFDELARDAIAKDGFDVILHAFVLEHIANPLGFLREQVALLRKGGRLVFEIPNSAEALITIYDIPEFERFYWIVAHRWYFSKKSLDYLLGQLGLTFEILLDQRYDLSNHMVWARDGKPGGMGRFTAILGDDLENQYRQALIRAGRCDTLIGVVTN
jgi:SAM-dependent methyltransferase